jgi:hemoglobin
MTLYEDLGGGPALRRLSDAFYERVLADELLREEHRQRWLELMRAAIEEVLVDRPELHKTLKAYFDWGTAIAKDVSQDPPGTDLGDPGPTPRWGRDGLV